MSNELAKGTEIVDLLMEISELDWARNSFSRVVYKSAEREFSEDRSGEPPYTSFRFKSEQPRLLENIRRAINNYRGKVEWVLIPHNRSPSRGVNWTICPKLTIEMDAAIRNSGLTAQHFFRERMPDFGVLAYQDMVDLATFLRRECTDEGSGTIKQTV